MKTFRNLLILGVLLTSQFAYMQTNVQVDLKKPGVQIPGTLYGIFFEDINYGADGGLYAEMIKNRSFDFPQNLLGWNTFGNVVVENKGPFENNPHYVRLSYPGHNDKHTGLENEGFFGVSVKAGESYRFSVWARAQGLTGEESIRVELVGADYNVIAKSVLKFQDKNWKKYETVLTPGKTDSKAKLRIFMTSKGVLDLEHVSLFPIDTWKGRQNGLRKDLAQALSDLQPGVFRFPGGCIVEGTDLQSRYQWKNTVGPVENRKLNENRWQYTFPHRFFPDYYQTYGLGFFEFFQLSEDIGSEPLPIISVGLACQFQNGCCEAHVPVGELNDYVQDALDLIEFANGDTLTKWGKLRAQMGHPKPFNMKFLGVGNEQWGPEYPERLEVFLKALREKHPEIKIIGSAGPNSEGKDFEYLWPEMKRLKVDLVDEHFYRPESWFLAQGARYDNYDRKGPKVFAGEYACHPKNRKNNFRSALMEAAFMTGIERNADVVEMATYAPLFAHVDGWQWRPDLIWFDNMRSVRSVNYLVQQLYGKFKGTRVLKTISNKQAISGQDGLFATTALDEKQNMVILKIANTSDREQTFSYHFTGLKNGERQVNTYLLQSDDQDVENTLENPDNVQVKEGSFAWSGPALELKMAPNTFQIFTFIK